MDVEQPQMKTRIAIALPVFAGKWISESAAAGVDWFVCQDRSCRLRSNARPPTNSAHENKRDLMVGTEIGLAASHKAEVSKKTP